MRGAAALVLGFVAGGCGLADPIVPEWVELRRPLPPCHTGAGPADPDEEQCLLDAYLAGRDAELVSTSTDGAGRPITSYLRVHANGTIEMFLDLAGDALTSWERFRCERLVPADDPAAGPNPRGTVFVQTGCEMLPVP